MCNQRRVEEDTTYHHWIQLAGKGQAERIINETCSVFSREGVCTDGFDESKPHLRRVVGSIEAEAILDVKLEPFNVC